MRKEIQKINWKNIGLEKIILIAVAGIFLLVSDVFSWGGLSSPKREECISSEGAVQEQILEERLQKILEQVEGVGKTKVMVRFTEKEEKETSYLGSTQQEESTDIAGVVIICEGAGKNQIRQEITEAASALFSISYHHIKVLKMEEFQ